MSNRYHDYLCVGQKRRILIACVFKTQVLFMWEGWGHFFHSTRKGGDPSSGLVIRRATVARPRRIVAIVAVALVAFPGGAGINEITLGCPNGLFVFDANLE
jgi:hypothetical protein